ncbi:MAG: hypothetical protein ACRDG7_04490 [Candidatus Limnocylindria bacterium]
MIATTSNIDTRRGQGTMRRVRRLALATGSLLRAIGSRWDDIVESGQLGPADVQASVSRPRSTWI